MKVDSTTSQFSSYASMMEHEEDLMTMAGMLVGDDSSQNSGGRGDMRKSNKPIMEKRRRARINNCLNELKNILLEAMKKDPARHSKLEKADILELTVRHLQNIQRNQLAIAMATDPTVLHRFKNGFSECVTEVNRYLGRLDGAEPGVRQRLLDHLGNCVNGLQQVGPAPFGSTGPVSSFPAAGSFPGAVLPQALGLHSSSPTVAAAIANLRHATNASATHIPPQQQHPATVPFSADDLNNNLLRTPPSQHHHLHHHTNETSARLMSAFAVASALPRPRPPSPPASPPPSLNTSSSSHESPTGMSTSSSMLQFSTTSSSSRNDSGLSDHSDLGSLSRSSSSSNRTSGGSAGGITSDPLDFSIGKVLSSDPGAQEHGRGGGNNPNLTPIRVVKVEPMQNMPAPSPDESNIPSNKDMWRPW